MRATGEGVQREGGRLQWVSVKFIRFGNTRRYSLVKKNSATTVPAAVWVMSYGLSRPCATASCTPIRARFSSSRARSVNGKGPAFLAISEKTARDVFILSW